MFGGFSQGFRGFSLEDSKLGFRGFRIQLQRIQKFHEDSGFKVLEDSGFRGFSVTRGFSTGFREDSERIQDSGIQSLYRLYRIQDSVVSVKLLPDCCILLQNSLVALHYALNLRVLGYYGLNF